MAFNSRSILLPLWGAVLLFCVFWAELGRLTGGISRPVLDSLFLGAPVWWDKGDALHILILHQSPVQE